MRFRPILARKPKPAKILSALMAENERFGRAVGIPVFKTTVQTWNRKPKFYTRTQLRGPLITTFVGTDNLRYFWINYGTRRVYRYGRPYMRFRPGFVPKTIPLQRQAGAGNVFGDYVYRRHTHARGIEPRRFDMVVAADVTPLYRRMMQRRIDKLARRGGFL